jgi:hypothetical protein
MVHDDDGDFHTLDLLQINNQPSVINLTAGTLRHKSRRQRHKGQICQDWGDDVVTIVAMTVTPEGMAFYGDFFAVSTDPCYQSLIRLSIAARDD